MCWYDKLLGMVGSFIQIGNLKIFGQKSENVSVSQIESIQSDISTQMHLLRHYNHLENTYLDSLVGKSYNYFNSKTKKFEETIVNHEDLLTLMKSKGSKFYDSIGVVSNPIKVVQSVKDNSVKLVENNTLVWIKKKNQLICMFTIYFDQIIGECGLAKLSDLSGNVQATMKVEQRGASHTVDYKINTVISPMILTNCLVVQLKKLDNSVSVDTAFPGILSPDDPDISTQSKEEYEFNKSFWENHVFLVSKP